MTLACSEHFVVNVGQILNVVRDECVSVLGGEPHLFAVAGPTPARFAGLSASQPRKRKACAMNG
jgi:hypothetical protein